VENGAEGKRVHVEELRSTIRHVLSDPAFANNAKHISQRLRSYGGPSQAARLIERFSQKALLLPQAA